VTNAIFLDTGFYYCVVNGTTDLKNALENVTQVYVYVRGKHMTHILHFSQLWEGIYYRMLFFLRYL
jgi:hypothetical protein